jgi:hypothetical protein
LGKAVAQSSAFAVVTLIVTLALLIREYFNNLFEIAEGYPRLIGMCYLVGGWLFAILCALLASVVAADDGVTVTRMSLLFASATLAFGPFFVFSPVKPIKLKKQTFLKTLATVARKKSTRHVTFFIFCALTALQALVAYDLYALLTSIELAFEQVVLTVFGYVLLTLFYLVVFYTTMLGRVFKVNELDVVEHIRKHAFVEFRRKLHVLSGRHYAKFYVAFFLLAVALQLAAVGVAIQDSLAGTYFADLTTTQRALFGVFSAALILFIVVSCIFVLVAAFRPVPLTLPSGDSKQLAQAIEAFTREDRDVLALHLAPPFGDHHSTFVAFTARLSAPLRHRIESVAQNLLSRNTREPVSKPIEDIGVAHLRPLEDQRRAVLTVSDDVEDNTVDEWLSVFMTRDAAAGDDDAVRRVDLFVTLASAFAAPSSWAAILAGSGDKEQKEKSAAPTTEQVDDMAVRSRRKHGSDSGSVRGESSSKRRKSGGGAPGSGAPGGASAPKSKSKGGPNSHGRVGKSVEMKHDKKKESSRSRRTDDDEENDHKEADESGAKQARDESEGESESESDNDDNDDNDDKAEAEEEHQPPMSDKEETHKSRSKPMSDEREKSLKKPSLSVEAEGKALNSSSNTATNASPVLIEMSSMPQSSKGSSSVSGDDGGGGGGSRGGSAPSQSGSQRQTPLSRDQSSQGPKLSSTSQVSRARRQSTSKDKEKSSSAAEERLAPAPPPPMAMSKDSEKSSSAAEDRLAPAPPPPMAMGAAPPPSGGAAPPVAAGPAPPPPMSAAAGPAKSSAAAGPAKSSVSDASPLRPSPFASLEKKSAMSKSSAVRDEKKKASAREEEPTLAPPPPMSQSSAGPTMAARRKFNKTAADPSPPMFMAMSSMSAEAAPPTDELADVFLGASETGRIVDIDLDAVLASAVELPSDFDVAAVAADGTPSRVTLGDSDALVTRLDCDASIATASAPTEVDNQNLLRLRGVVTRDGVALAVWYAPDSPPSSVASALSATIKVADIGRLMLHLVRALMHLHASGRVHGAISPAAVMVVVPADGGSTRAVLCDWLGGDDRKPTDATFLAPERRSGASRSVAADIFALGALLQWCTNEQTAGSATVKRRSAMSVLAERMTAANASARPSLDAVLNDVRSWEAK